MNAKAQLGAGIVASIGAGWLLYSRNARNGGSNSGIPSSIAPELATDIVMTPIRRTNHQWARPIIEQAFKDVVGRAGSIFELQYAQAVAFLESSYGKGWKDPMKGCFNWGAVQCPANAQTGPGCVPYQDSQSSGQKYDVSFRCYGSDLEGARDVIKHVFVKRAQTAAILADTAGTNFRASYAMRRESYYGGFCVKSTARYGTAAANASFAHPDRDEGTRACMAEAVGLHANRVQGLVREIAAAVGDKRVFPLGTFADADTWYIAKNGPKL